MSKWWLLGGAAAGVWWAYQKKKKCACKQVEPTLSADFDATIPQAAPATAELVGGSGGQV